jgi:hypothetical protein
MSYNITNIDTLYIKATMSWKDVCTLLKQEGNLPALCFLDDLKMPSEGDEVTLTEISWSATASGRNWGFFKNTVAKFIKGEVQGIVTWEGGDSVEGFAIKDGKYYKCDVVQRLDLPDGFTQ